MQVGDPVLVKTFDSMQTCDHGVITADTGDNIFLVTTDSDGLDIYVHANYLEIDYAERKRHKKARAA